MAKSNKFILQYAEVFKNVTIDLEGRKPPKYLIKRFVQLIKVEIGEPRYENMCTYSLETIIVTAFLAILCNASTWTQIADFTYLNRKWLCKFIPLDKESTPIDDTYRRVFSLIDGNELNAVTKKYMLSIFTKIKNAINKYKEKNSIETKDLLDSKGKIILNVDGKVARATGRYLDEESKKKKVQNLQTLNVYNSSDGVTLFSIPINDKTNEIPVAQEVISKMDLKNKIITFDAIHAQHKTFDIVLKKHGDYVISLKGNQGSAFEEIDLTINDEFLKKIKEKNKDNYMTYYSFFDYKNKITKEYYQIPFSEFYIEKGKTNDGTDKWVGARNIVVYRKPNKKTGEIITQYFVTSLNDLESEVEAIQARWDVENLLHRYLDMAFNEDMNKTMDATAFNNFSILNKLCLSLLKIVKPLIKDMAILRLKKCFSYRPLEMLSLILAVLDVDLIEQAFNNTK